MSRVIINRSRLKAVWLWLAEARHAWLATAVILRCFRCIASPAYDGAHHTYQGLVSSATRYRHGALGHI
jgi:hypothetical protein